jgi:hypothetical protein
MVPGAVLAASPKLSQPVEAPTKAAWRLMGAAITVAGPATMHALRKAGLGRITTDRSLPIPRRVG